MFTKLGIINRSNEMFFRLFEELKIMLILRDISGTIQRYLRLR